jgi:hypothetical protein
MKEGVVVMMSDIQRIIAALVLVMGLGGMMGSRVCAEEHPSYADEKLAEAPIFDDTMLLNGYAEKLVEEPKDILEAMIKDDTLEVHKTAAAVRVYKDRFSREVFSREKTAMEKNLLRRLNRTPSAFVQVEIFHTLLNMDRYKYFKTMIPALIQKLDHYNTTVNEMAYQSLLDVIEGGHNRALEARVVFNTLRKVLFLSRKRLENVQEPGSRLAQKLEILRWSIKVLGSQELKRLPKEVINLL